MIARHFETGNSPVLNVSILGEGQTCVRYPMLPVPHRNAGFAEGQTVHIHRPSAGLIFRVDDESLPGTGEPHLNAWLWEPNFYAGEVTAELEGSDGELIGTYLLDVSPDPSKIGRDLFLQMIREIYDEAPELIAGSEPAQTRIGVLGTAADPFVALSRLRRYGPAFLRALSALASRPIHTARETREQVPLHKARRVDRYTALSALRDENALRLIREGVADMNNNTSSLIKLDVPKSELHLDGAANRCIAAFSNAVLRRVLEIRSKVQRLSFNEEPGSARTGLMSRWPVRERFLDWMEQELKARIRKPPLSLVVRPEITAAGLNAVAAHPLYARAHGLAWRVLRMGISDLLTDERLWLSPTWEIYERWCFVKLAALLRAVRPGLKWERQTEHKSRADAVWIGYGDGANLELLLQPVFTAWDQAPGRVWRSLSAELKPDIALMINGEVPRWVALDAKYRVARGSVLEGMRSAHLYHDALRFRGIAPERSLLLLPASGGASWLEAKAFQKEHAIGAVVISPVSCEATVLHSILDLQNGSA